MQVAIVLNREAGSLRDADPEAVVPAVQAAFAEAGHSAEVVLTAAAELEAALRRQSERADVLVIGGGDGSTATAAAVAVERQRPLGVLPAGTLNLFARDLGVPLPLADAARALAGAAVDHVDVGEVNGRLFVNRATLGVLPWIIRQRDWQRYHGREEKWPALALAALRALRRDPHLRLTMEWPEGREQIDTQFLMVANNPVSDSFGPLFHRDRLDSGLLGIYATCGHGTGPLVRLALTALRSRWNLDPQVRRFTAERVVVQSPRPKLRLSLDGEIGLLTPPLHFRIHKRRLPVLRPRSEP